MRRGAILNRLHASNDFLPADPFTAYRERRREQPILANQQCDGVPVRRAQAVFQLFPLINDRTIAPGLEKARMSGLYWLPELPEPGEWRARLRALAAGDPAPGADRTSHTAAA